MTSESPSIVDVAKRAGVSVATASRVMSGSTYPVSEGTRERVLLAARELRYVPNSLARSLKAQRSKLIAVLVGDNADPYFAQVARGVEEVANSHGYLTIICNTERDPIRELSYLQTLQDYRADGIVFTGSGSDETSVPEQLEIDDMIEKIQRRGAAIVMLSPHNLQAPSIQPDNLGGAYELTRYLIELGHTRIAFVTGPASVTVANQRLQGYRQALTESGITPDDTLLFPGNFTQAGGERAAAMLNQLPREKRPSAVFACNDETAFGLMYGLRQHGWRLPEDISICGFGNLPMARMVTPALTTANISLRELGRAGAQKILALLQHQDTSAQETFPTTIVKRASTIPFAHATSNIDEK
ncbi:LacI family DNA-binding transcriptional regulator [Dictyobacter aurantiacus]|uniref:LacI family transcriptional regulator n=1 Tax=Dictyobacter aurantiacus TaxID=1936993 RepID=A0A401ZIL6_9CHLR|nr:LacI family DNA-binding transcriptional regulator [Dictyobacter aurantiacus]GCE06701.1 LacI family transcriptional regulator [Dictyobacter aurantiacus]